MNQSKLDPISPADAIDMYTEERKEDARWATRDKISDVMDIFLGWADEGNLDDMNDLTGRQLRDFRTYLRDERDQSKISMNGVMSILRRFLVFCVEIEAVAPGLPDKTPIPNVSSDEEVSQEKPTEEEVKSILQYLKTHRPASRERLEFASIEEIGWRTGAVRSQDIEDVDAPGKAVNLKHRPEPDKPQKKGTPLKNASDGERNVNISSELAEIYEQYLNSPDRNGSNDKFGRKPVFTTNSGRVTESTIRRDFYKLSRPCVYSDECPHDRNHSKCEATKNKNASKCPSSFSMHPLRRYSIEKQIEEGVPKELLVDRVDVSLSVLNKHYDQRSEERRRKHRLKILSRVFSGYGSDDGALDVTSPDELFDDDGMIDGSQISTLQARTVDDEDDTEDDSDSVAESNHLTLDNFSDSASVTLQPYLVPIVGMITCANWTLDRLNREIKSLTMTMSDTGPSGDRIAKVSGAYLVMILMLAVDLKLIGLV